MRLLYVASQPVGYTPHERHLEWLMREAMARGHDCRLLAPRNHDQPITLAREMPLTSIEFDPDTLAVPAMSYGAPYRNTDFAQMSERQFDRYLELIEQGMLVAAGELEPDLIHVNHLWIPAAMARSIFHGRPIVVTAHQDEILLARRSPRLLRRVLAPVRQVERVMTLTAEHSRYIGEMFGVREDRVQVMGTGVDGECYRPARRSTGEQFRLVVERHALALPVNNAIRVVYAGPEDDDIVELLAEAAPKVAHAVPQMRFIAALRGAGEQGSPVERRLRQAGMSVIRLDDQATVAELLRGCHVCVLPFASDEVPQLMLGALASGCRLVVAELSLLDDWPERQLFGSDDLARDAIARVRVGGDSDAVDRLTAAISTQCASSRMGPLGKIAAEVSSRFDWRSIFRRTEAVYESLARSTPMVKF